jgi:cell division septation protein DedD
MRSRIIIAAATGIVAIAMLPLGASGVDAQAATQSATPPSDSAAILVYRRAQRLVNDGQGSEGRALVDSMLNAADPRSPAEAEALYWRAMLAESWDVAQRDYLRIMIEHERSPRAGVAMLRLAQGELARGDRDAAVRYLERLAREAPESPARAEAGLWHGRILVERGEGMAGCTMLRNSRSLVPPGSLELENQYTFLLQACPEPGAVVGAALPTPAQTPPVTSGAAPPTGTPPATTPPATQTPPTTQSTAPPPRPAPATAPAPGPTWSVQVAALGTRSEADALVARLKSRGYDARVDGAAAPFRVRFGRYPSASAAAAAMNGYKTRERADAFVVEVPRG